MSLDKAGSVYILVIEDDQALREFLADQLVNRGYKVMTSDNGSEAVECVQNSKFHLVISDFRMPGMDGLKTLKAIKEVDPDVPVIIASGLGSEELAEDAMKKGAFHFLSKPIAMKELFSQIERALEKSGVQMESLLETVLNRFRQLFHADEGSLMLLDRNKHLYIAYSFGLSEEIVYLTTLMLGERVAGLAVKQGREFLINGGLEKYPNFRGIEKKPRIRSSLVIPIFYQKKILGVLNLNRTQTLQDFTPEDLKKASVLAAQMAPEIHAAQLRQDLEGSLRDLKAAHSKLINNKKPV